MLFSPGWRSSTKQTTVLVYFSLGLVLGGMLSAGILWVLSGLFAPLPQRVSWAVVLTAATLGVSREFGWVKIALPQNARQIPQEVLRRRVRLGAMQFGFELGSGVRTYVSSSAPYVLIIAIVLLGPGPVVALLVGAAFGVGRATTAIQGYVYGHTAWDAYRMSQLAWATRLSTVSILSALAFLMN